MVSVLHFRKTKVFDSQWKMLILLSRIYHSQCPKNIMLSDDQKANSDVMFVLYTNWKAVQLYTVVKATLNPQL